MSTKFQKCNSTNNNQDVLRFKLLCYQSTFNKIVNFYFCDLGIVVYLCYFTTTILTTEGIDSFLVSYDGITVKKHVLMADSVSSPLNAVSTHSFNCPQSPPSPSPDFKKSSQTSRVCRKPCKCSRGR